MVIGRLTNGRVFEKNPVQQIADENLIEKARPGIRYSIQARS
jgi:hypothetical protein